MAPALPAGRLEPVISARTEFHYGKHYQGYANPNGSSPGPRWRTSLEEIAPQRADPGQSGIFNNAAQVWNHTLLEEPQARDAPCRRTWPWSSTAASAA